MKVYLAQECDHGEWTIHKAFFNKEKAQAFIDADNAIYDEYEKEYKTWAGHQAKALENHTKSLDLDDFIIGIEFLRVWREANPSPERPDTVSICSRLSVGELEVEE